MAQSGFTPIKLYLSTTAAAVPLAADLAPGELAINNNDGKLFYEDSAGVVQVLATKASAANSFSAGTTGLTPNTATTGAVTLAGTLAVANGGTGVTSSTGTGNTVLSTSPTLVTPALGTPASGVVTNLTGTASININGTVGATTPTTVVATQVDITAQGDLRLQDTTGGEYVALQAPATIATSYTLTLPVDDGTNGQALITDGSGVLSWSTAASGDVYGPASATDNAVARFDLTTGKIIQNSAVTIADDGATVIAANSTTDGLRITQVGTGNALLVEDSANPDATPFVIDSNGRGIFGNTTFLQINTYSNEEKLSVYGASGQGIQIGDFSANQFASGLNFGKSRSGTVGTGTIVNNGDALGNIIFNGFNGSSYNQAAIISSAVDGTPGTNDMPGRLVFSTTADGASSPTERMRIASTGTISLGAAPGSESLRVTPVASAVNFLNVAGAVTGANPHLQANGSDTNIGLIYTTKGAGQHFFQTNNFGSIQFLVAHTASAVNYLEVTGSAAGVGSPYLQAAGSDTNITISYYTKGAGTHNFATNGAIQFLVAHTASAVNYLQVTGATTGNYPYFTAQGSDTNVSAGMYSKGTGALFFGSNGGTNLFAIANTTSAVNFLQVTGAATGGNVAISAQGSDSNVNLVATSKGSGSIGLFTSAFSTLQLNVSHTASAVNYVNITGAATGSGVSLGAAGSDTNIDLALTPKGTGNVRFGTLTANADAPITGFITIKDSAGNLRKLAVIA